MSIITFDTTGFPAEYTIHYATNSDINSVKTDAINLGNTVAKLVAGIANDEENMPKIEIHGNKDQGNEFADDIRVNLALTYGLKDIEIEVIG